MNDKQNIEEQELLVVVLGMHRGGTSAVTRALDCVGVSLGEKHLQANEDNKKGFWEDREVVSLNEEVLAAIDQSWFSLRSLSDSDVKALENAGLIKRASSLLQERLCVNPRFGFKDPRTTKLLAFWRRVFESQGWRPFYVFVVRNPKSIVRSLLERDQFSYEHSYLLWLEYVLSALSHSDLHNTLLIDYDELLANPRSELNRLAGFLKAPLDNKKATNYAEHFLEHGLRHSVSSREDLANDPCVPALVQEIYDFLLQVQQGRANLSDAIASAMLSTWRQELHRLRPLFQLCDRVDRAHRLSSAHVLHLEQAVKERDDHALNLQHKLAAANRQVSILNQRVNEIFNSRSWRVTKPIRTVGSLVRKSNFLLGLTKLVALLVDESERQKVRQIAHSQGGYGRLIVKAFAILKREGLSAVFWRIRYRLDRRYVLTSDGERIDSNNYSAWLYKYQIPLKTLIAESEAFFQEVSQPPKISIIMPVFNVRPVYLRQAIRSVQEQIYKNWELCIADDASTNADIRPLLESLSKEDTRIKVLFRHENGHISKASNSALTMVTGDFIALMDNDDLLAPDALSEVAKAVVRNPSVKVIYSDEDKINDQGERYNPYFKPDFNPDLLHSHHFMAHLAVYERSLIDEIGGWRSEFDGAQDYDLILRAVERVTSQQIIHIPKVLYHWRVHSESTAFDASAKPYAMQAGERALTRAMERRSLKATVHYVGIGYRVKYEVPQPHPPVSIIIPTYNGLTMLRGCIDSVLKKSSYTHFEILVIDNNSDDPEVLSYLQELVRDQRIRCIRDERPFNYSALNNIGVENARGEYVCFMNNDIQVIATDWLTEMLSHAARPEVGAVGAKLLYPDGTLQHSGVVLGIGGIAGHSHKGLPAESPGYCGRVALISNFSAVTAACLLIEKEKFLKAGSFDSQNLKVALNDVDLCLRLQALGYWNVYTPYAELYHLESASRGYEDNPEKIRRFEGEVAFMQNKWANVLANDPAYNRNLTLDAEDFSLAWPPRVESL
jgi:glycosyltransferase involved in cell wall biosynthesis